MNRAYGDSRPQNRQQSVFVGNISYDVSEEQLKDVFSKVGTVVHLRMVTDRETGRPKGYGFCEFADVKMAEAAIRNLNGYDLNGRNLRVDSAVLSRDEDHGTREVPVLEDSPYGPDCNPSDAPAKISKSVASLPPEKMFELMAQMKEIVRANPSEARNMLLSNPQLCYALLQAQVVMRLVDPGVAQSMLHRESQGPTHPFHLPPPPGNNSHFNLPPSERPRMAAPPAPAPVGYGGPPPSFNAPPHNGGGIFNQPPPSQPAPSAAPHYSANEREDAELLMQVLNLREDEIALLPPEDRQKVLALRSQLRTAV